MIKEIRDKKVQRYGLKTLRKRQKAEGRRQKVLVVVLLLLCGFAVQAQNKLPQGKWEVKQITVEKNTNGNPQTTVYNAVTEVKNDIRFPQMMEVKNGENMVLCYPDSIENITTEYTLENNQLTIKGIGTALQYQYSIDGGLLTLTSTCSYTSNAMEGNRKNIVETWVFTLKKQE